MKKFFEYIGIVFLFIFSFIFTEKTATVLKEQDDIMIKIRDVEKNYYIEPKEAVILNNTFIPGISGQKVNISDSYYKMKKMNLFNETLLILENIKPKELLKNNKNKFIIGGNKSKKEVALVFIVKDYIGDLLDILEKNNIESNIFVTSDFLENNNNIINSISKKHIIGNLSNNMNYNDSDFIWMNTIIKKFNDNYCYTETLNEDILKICNQNKAYTIVPTTIIKSKPLLNISRKLNNGDIIAFYVNEENIKELDMLIKEIKSRGEEIVKLDKLLMEK